jgi:hypothetical protein
VTGQELMATLYADIEHGDEKHRAWLKAKLDAWAPRVADATELELAKAKLADYKAAVTDHLHLSMTALLAGSEAAAFAKLHAKVDQLRAALKIHEPYRNVCSCGLVCSNPTLLGHLRDNPDHTDASPMRVADTP